MLRVNKDCAAPDHEIECDHSSNPSRVAEHLEANQPAIPRTLNSLSRDEGENVNANNYTSPISSQSIGLALPYELIEEGLAAQYKYLVRNRILASDSASQRPTSSIGAEEASAPTLSSSDLTRPSTELVDPNHYTQPRAYSNGYWAPTDPVTQNCPTAHLPNVRKRPNFLATLALTSLNHFAAKPFAPPQREILAPSARLTLMESHPEPLVQTPTLTPAPEIATVPIPIVAVQPEQKVVISKPDISPEAKDHSLKLTSPYTHMIKAYIKSFMSYFNLRLKRINGKITLVSSGTTSTGLFTIYKTINAHVFSRSFRSWKWRIEPRLIPNHPHAYEAAHRLACHNAIHALIAKAKKTVYEVSASHRSKGLRGYHDHYTSRDLEYPVQKDEMIPTDVIVMIDVDYYLDMPTWISYGLPIIMYTMTPGAISGRYHNTSWTIENSQLSVQVTGGARYTHPLWNYNHDTMIVTTPYGYKVHTRVDIRPVDDLRSIICLTPVHFEYTLPWAMGKRMDGANLTRLETNCTEHYESLTIMTPAGKMHSIRNKTASACVTVPHDVMTALFQRFNESENPKISDIQTTLDKLGITKSNVLDSYNAAGVTIGYFRELAGKPLSNTAVVEHYTYMLEDSEASMDHSEKPRVDEKLSLPSVTTIPAKVPFANTSNDAAAEVTRHQDVRNPRDFTVPPDFLQYVKEFKELSLSEAMLTPRSLTPYTMEEISSRQTLPAQVLKNTRTTIEPIPNIRDSRECKVSAFTKAEAYSSFKDPRNISATDPTHTLTLSCYTYAVKEAFFKKTSWYCPGLSLPNMAQKLQSFVHLASSLKLDVAETDYSRYDGTISKSLRESVEETMYSDLFSLPVDSHQMIKFIKAEYHAKAHTKYGPYDPDGSRLSGSPLTTDGNTLIGAVVDYYTLRITTNWSKEECYQRLGLHFGDDGISLFVDDAHKIATSVGLKLKLERRTEGHPLGFLGRLFPNIWADLSSIQDPLRVWPKINIVMNGSAKTALQQRWYAYLASDRHTPCLRAYCEKMLLLTGYIQPPNIDYNKVENYLIRTTQSMWPQVKSQALDDLERDVLQIDTDKFLNIVRQATNPRRLIACLKSQVFTTMDFDPLPEHVRVQGDQISIVNTRNLPGTDKTHTKPSEPNVKSTNYNATPQCPKPKPHDETKTRAKKAKQSTPKKSSSPKPNAPSA